MPEFVIQPIDEANRSWMRDFLIKHWGSVMMVTGGKMIDVSKLAGFMAVMGEQPVGLITYHIEQGACEIVSLDSTLEKMGIGSALVGQVTKTAIEQDCHKIWLITTNDNMNALKFYQKRGFYLVAVHRFAVERARQLKPQIPMLGHAGIPLRDELELEMPLIGG